MVRSGNGSYVKARALLDSGAGCSVVKKSFVERFKVHQQFTGNNIFGVGDIKVNVPGTIAKLVFKPRGKTVPIISVVATVMYRVTGNIPYYDTEIRTHLDSSKLELADPALDKSQDVDIILGTDVLNYIYTGSKILTNIPGVEAYGTCFGHVLMGATWNYPSSLTTPTAGTSVEDYGIHATRLEDVLERFWRVEQPPEERPQHPEHLECERLYTSTTQRLDNGQFMVRLPLRADRPKLGESRALAMRRLISLEARLAKNPVFAEKYKEFMRDYEALGHMSKSDFNFESEHYVIPHHGIFKKGSEKIRVVYNAAANSSTGVSLNQCLHSGKPLQNDITQILLNFRRHQVVFTTDIRMMFRQTWIHPSDRRYQLILWREDPSQDVQVYELNTNTYGLRSSPFIAIRTLLRLADDWEAQHPDSPAAHIMRRDVYVDDILTGADSLTEAQELKSELIELMRSAGYELRKWSSNRRELLQDLPQEHCEMPRQFDTDDKSFIKVLGIQWNPMSDSMSYQLNIPLGQPTTKRSILSTIARLYDPCGYCAPIIFRFKLFLQSLFTDGLQWDEPLSHTQDLQWNELIQDLHHLSQLQIPRCVTLPGAVSHSLHGFGDASELGYGACVYLRTEDASGNVLVRFNASTQAPFMADLPADRVTAARAFSGVATDFAGPYWVKSSHLRNAKSLKAYLCVFVCLGTKAVHLELVSSLSTEAFIAAFTRRNFVAKVSAGSSILLVPLTCQAW
ncbi:uncharacterized protein LOC134678100 [Cydia fagiglandana]|uniref:uncharacterized protein LOC134678100 n=1 Tax=Cydia fagiglandana TaxID=1458189 RepID=UPI002FEE408B